VDHNLLQTDNKNADDHKFLQTAAARYGIHFSMPGNGVSHQVHMERFGVRSETLLGADSHTPGAAEVSMLGIGAGGLDVALAGRVSLSSSVPGSRCQAYRQPAGVAAPRTSFLKWACAAAPRIIEYYGRQKIFATTETPAYGHRNRRDDTIFPSDERPGNI
jgi:hypothetical protein